MEGIKKEKLIEYIEQFREQQLIEADIRKVVEQMKHHKQVNKKFTDKLQELGYHVYIVREYSHKLRVTRQYKHISAEGDHWGKQFSVEIYSYGESLTWDSILKQLDRCSFKQQEEQYKNRLENHDKEVSGLKEVLAYLQEKEKIIEGFHFYQLIHKVKDAIRDSQ